jgi:hypothetical protein
MHIIYLYLYIYTVVHPARVAVGGGAVGLRQGQRGGGGGDGERVVLGVVVVDVEAAGRRALRGLGGAVESSGWLLLVPVVCFVCRRELHRTRYTGHGQRTAG